jgi:hypothetical protein
MSVVNLGGDLFDLVEFWHVAAQVGEFLSNSNKRASNSRARRKKALAEGANPEAGQKKPYSPIPHRYLA